MGENWSAYSDINRDYYTRQRSSQGDIVDLPVGKYHVDIEDMYLKFNKQQQPAFYVKMIVKGSQNGQYIGACAFFYQVLIARDSNDGIRIHTALEFLRGMQVIPSESIVFDGLPALDNLVTSIKGIIEREKKLFILDVSKNQRDYSVYRIEGYVNNYAQPQQQYQQYGQPVQQYQQQYTPAQQQYGQVPNQNQPAVPQYGAQQSAQVVQGYQQQVAQGAQQYAAPQQQPMQQPQGQQYAPQGAMQPQQQMQPVPPQPVQQAQYVAQQPAQYQQQAQQPQAQQFQVQAAPNDDVPF